jgi:S1-C subfamily serine protease
LPTYSEAQERKVAQATVDTGRSDACGGFNLLFLATNRGPLDSTRAIVDGLDRLSPGGLAGLLDGDTIRAVNDLSVGWTALRGWNFRPGDTNALEVSGRRGRRRVSLVVGEYVSLPTDSVGKDVRVSQGVRMPLDYSFRACRPRP